MSRKAKSGLNAGEAQAIISDVDGADRAAARLAISKGVEAAQNKWLPAEFIAEALALELRNIAKTNLSSKGVADYLRFLAETMEETSDVH